jgi:hypothetical protein
MHFAFGLFGGLVVGFVGAFLFLGKIVGPAVARRWPPERSGRMERGIGGRLHTCYPDANRSLSVHELKPAWSRVFLCRYILRLKARIRELEKRLATYE